MGNSTAMLHCEVWSASGTGCAGWRRIYGCTLWLMCVITSALFVERSLASATSDESVKMTSESMRFLDWSTIVATEWRQTMNEVAIEGDRRKVTATVVKEEEHRIARESLQTWLTPTEKWHFLIGYSDVYALRVANRLTQGARVHHFPTRNSSLHYFLTFISAASAEVLRKHQRIFHVVEPLLPYIKIEDLTLGKLIRNQEDTKRDTERDTEQAPNEPLALKATVAHGALATGEIKALARRWQVVLQRELRDPLLSPDTTTLRYMDAGGQTGIHAGDEDHGTRRDSTREMRKAGDEVQSIECRGEVTAIVCAPIAKSALRGAANLMAAHAVVQLVELNPRYEVFNKWAKYVTQSVSGKRLPIFNKGLLGEGEVIACADTGIDMDHCFFRDKDRAVPFNAVDMQARKVVQYYVASWGDKTDFADGHGTHVAGTIAGDTDEDASNHFAGMAPAAKLAFCDLGSNASNLKAPIELGKGVFDYGYMAGARIFSNSWGVLRPEYSTNAHEVDSFSYLNENVLIIFAVGNQGTLGKGTVASPASSKNCLAVGASFNAAASLASQREDYSKVLMKPSTVAPFSSIGPTVDGRIKPDVLAPGMIVWSSVPDFGHGPPEQNCQVGPKQVSKDHMKILEKKSSVVKYLYYKDSTHFPALVFLFYAKTVFATCLAEAMLQGTSSSTPVVAGLAALARQYFREGHYPSGKKNLKDGFIPSGALLKAVMIHSAVPEQRYVNSSGMNDLHLAPDYVQGYGLVVLEKVLLFAKPRSKHQPSHLFVLSGQKDDAVVKHKSFQTFTFKVTSSKEPLRMTMVWMDPPAAPSSLHPMVNDLNLKALTPHRKCIYPNGMNGEDSINNVEVIHVMKPKKGCWEVTVEAARVMNDRQPYALLVTGAFIFKARSGYRPGTIFRGNDYYSSHDNVTSDAHPQGSASWEYHCHFCILLGSLCFVITLSYFLS